MSFLRNLVRDLVDKKLWPLAALLVATLVAVPVVLGGGAPASSDPLPAAGAATAIIGGTTPAPPVAEVVTDGGLRKRRGAVRDPFRQQYVAKKPAATATAVAKPAPTPTPKSTPSPSPVRSGGTSGTTTTTTTPTVKPTVKPTPAPKPTPKPTAPATDPLDVYRVTVAFGEPGSQRTLRDFGRLSSLPSANDSLFVFLGVLSGGKKAVFLVKQGVKATGDGACRPSKATCDTVEMESGDTVFFDVETDKGVVQYQLDVESVRRRTAAQALAARTKAAADAVRATTTLRATKESGAGPGESLRSDAYRWDADKTVLVRRKRQASSKLKVPTGLAPALRVAVGEVAAAADGAWHPTTP